MAKQPMAEVFGYLIDDMSPEAIRHRRDRACPFNNKVSSCTKDKIENPLGVCSVYAGNSVTITCPIRFREDWVITSDAVAFFFPPGTAWTDLTEIKLNDANGKSAGNIDMVLVAYNEDGDLLDFGSLEVQAVYISGNIRKPFTEYMKEPAANANLNWEGKRDYPRADFLSSSRKRLAPQLIYKGGILHAWKKKMAVAVDEAFFAEIPALPEVKKEEADVAWLVYDLVLDRATKRRKLTLMRTIYTQFTDALDTITTSKPGLEADFRKVLQRRLDEGNKRTLVSASTTALSDLFADADSEESTKVVED